MEANQLAAMQMQAQEVHALNSARVEEFKKRWEEADVDGMERHRVAYALWPLMRYIGTLRLAMLGDEEFADDVKRQLALYGGNE